MNFCALNRCVPLGRGRNFGFSVTELIMVVLILAVVAMLAGPSFSEFYGRQRLKGAASEAVSDLQFARSESVERNAPVTVTFSAAGYNIVGGGTNLKTVTLTAGNSISSGTGMVATFEPVRAMATVTNGPVIFANSSTPGTVQISVNAMGRPRICSPSGVIVSYETC